VEKWYQWRKALRRDDVIKAIKFKGPTYVPIYFFNRDQDQSDIVAIEVQHHFKGPHKNYSEWGFTWSKLDETMGQPKEILIKEWSDLHTLVVPNPNMLSRFNQVNFFMHQYPDRYRMAALGLSGFTTMWCLRGFDNLMLDLVQETDKVIQLAELVFDFEQELIKALSVYGFDAVAFFDDWGTQNQLLISPHSWRKIFKPFYSRQFELIHSLGMDVYFHCCGQILPIIPDLIEAGVDILNLSQPNLYNIRELGKEFGGRVCFICPVSYQTTSILGTREQIFEDVQLLFDSLGCYNGGLLGYVEEYKSIGMSEENYQACIDAFRSIGRYY
jgi:uroporphyrinogen decarboxylase